MTHRPAVRPWRHLDRRRPIRDRHRVDDPGRAAQEVQVLFYERAHVGIRHECSAGQCENIGLVHSAGAARNPGGRGIRHVVFGPCHEERLLLMNMVQPPKIGIALVHDIEVIPKPHNVTKSILNTRFCMCFRVGYNITDIMFEISIVGKFFLTRLR